MPPALRQQRHHLGGGLLDRAAGHVDDRPVVLAAQFARLRDLGRHRLAVDVIFGVVLGAQPEQPVLPDLHDTLRARGQAHHQRLRQRLELGRHRHAGHQREVRGLDATVGEIDRGRRLRGARHPDQHHVGLLHVVDVLAVVVQHGVVQRVDPLEILGVEDVLCADPGLRLAAEISLEQVQHRARGSTGTARRARGRSFPAVRRDPFPATCRARSPATSRSRSAPGRAACPSAPADACARPAPSRCIARPRRAPR